MDFTDIVNLAIKLLFTLFSLLAIAWINKKNTAIDREQLTAWVKIAVAAAEQLYTSVDGELKKAYVVKFLAGKGFKVDTAEIDATIEGEVLKLHNKLNEATNE